MSNLDDPANPGITYNANICFTSSANFLFYIHGSQNSRFSSMNAATVRVKVKRSWFLEFEIW